MVGTNLHQLKGGVIQQLIAIFENGHTVADQVLFNCKKLISLAARARMRQSFHFLKVTQEL